MMRRVQYVHVYIYIYISYRECDHVRGRQAAALPVSATADGMHLQQCTGIWRAADAACRWQATAVGSPLDVHGNPQYPREGKGWDPGKLEPGSERR